MATPILVFFIGGTDVHNRENIAIATDDSLVDLVGKIYGNTSIRIHSIGGIEAITIGSITS